MSDENDFWTVIDDILSALDDVGCCSNISEAARNFLESTLKEIVLSIVRVAVRAFRWVWNKLNLVMKHIISALQNLFRRMKRKFLFSDNVKNSRFTYAYVPEMRDAVSLLCSEIKRRVESTVRNGKSCHIMASAESRITMTCSVLLSSLANVTSTSQQITIYHIKIAVFRALSMTSVATTTFTRTHICPPMEGIKRKNGPNQNSDQNSRGGFKRQCKAFSTKRFGLADAGVGDEGGFAPYIQENKEALELIKEAIEKAGYTGKIEIGMDVAASEFYKDGKYDLDFKNPNSDKSKWLEPDALSQLYLDWIKAYPTVSVEDPFEQDDWAAWAKYCASVTNQVVGDDLTVTNPKASQMAVEKKACNNLLLKMNQTGRITEAIKAHNLAKSNGWGTMVSHRSGETEDSFIADLVVGLCTGQIKMGAPCHSERLAKYSHMLRIEEELGAKVKDAGKNFHHLV